MTTDETLMIEIRKDEKVTENFIEDDKGMHAH